MNAFICNPLMRAVLRQRELMARRTNGALRKIAQRDADYKIVAGQQQPQRQASYAYDADAPEREREP